MSLPVERGWINFLVDRLVGWWCGLPGESCSYTVESLRIPVGSHGAIQLAASLYRPTIASPHGTILVRTSYGIGPMMALGHARMFASRGYQVLLAACRGTDPSDGQEVVVGVYEAEDGLATVAWMREQPWYTGSFATYGGSYLGFTQWAILSDPPDDMKAAVISTGPHNFGAFTWGNGAMESHILAWADLMTAPKRGVTPGISYIKQLPQTLKPLYDSVPLVGGIKEHFQGHAPPWLEEVVMDNNLSGSLSKSMNQREALHRAKLPILQVTGWNDSVMPMILDQHSILAERGIEAYLVIGPWSHLGAQRGVTIANAFGFIEMHLAGRGKGFPTTPCRAFITGAEQWRDLQSWPPSPVSKQELHLAPGKGLSSQKPSDQVSSSSFTFNPTEPTPPTGMPRPFDDMIPASYDDTSLAQRTDVVAFTSKPLDTDLEVCGQPFIELHHSSDNPNVDILVRLSEVNSKGKSRRISDVYKRLDPARGPGPLELHLKDCGHVFRRGSSIRVIVAGGAHPAYIRNLGTVEHPGTGSTTRPAVHTVHHSVGQMSKLVLPVTALIS